MKIYLYILVLSVFTTSIVAQDTSAPKHEMRGVWIATIFNIDWPSSKYTTVRQQKNEYLNLLDSLEKVNVNAVLFQVRPQGDALYKSSLEPWSEYLMGEQGKEPSDVSGSYDPLQFITEESHKRGMEVHAWANPYRITAYADSSRLDTNHVYFKHPEWFVKHTADNRFYFIPGIEESQEFVLDVVEEIVSNYDIDALHFDDYFYQYPDKYGNNINDSLQYSQYVYQFDSTTGVKLDTLYLNDDTIVVTEEEREFDNIHDWRRNNVNTMVEAVSHRVKQTKPWVRFGISPFGVYKNKDYQNPDGSETQAGTTNYYTLYADVLYWMDKEWVDYITPQIYWRTNHDKAAFDVLLNWWDNHSNENVKLYIGQGLYKLDNPTYTKYDFWKSTKGYYNQIDLVRASKNAEGSMHFSAKYFITNPLNITEELSQNQYKYPAIIPPYANAEINNSVVRKIEASGSRIKGVKLQWDDIVDNDIRYYLVYRFEGDEVGDVQNAKNIIAKVPGYKLKQEFVDNSVKMWKKYTYVITSVDRFNVESRVSKPITLKGKHSSVKIYNE